MIIYIDGKSCGAESGEYIYDVARRNKIDIPALCRSDAFEGLSSCRLCIVEAEDRGKTKIVTSCNFPVSENLKIYTSTDRIRGLRRTVIMLTALRLKDTSPLQKLMEEYGVEPPKRFKPLKDQCMLCGLCVKACESLGANAIGTAMRGTDKRVEPPFGQLPSDCIGCGSCAEVCPTHAIECTQRDNIRHIWEQDFEMVRCDVCKEYYATKKQIEHVRDSIKEKDTDYLKCPRCRRIDVASKFGEIFGDYF